MGTVPQGSAARTREPSESHRRGRADRLSVTAWPSLYRPDEGHRVSWRALRARVRAPRSYPSKDAIGRWSFGLFAGGRRSLATFRSAAGVALDFDHGAPLERVVGAFLGLRGFVHSTWRSTPEAPRWRLAVVLSRPVDIEEHDRVWRAVAAQAERAELALDYAARDASRCWALPAQRPGYAFATLDGEPLDVTEALARFPAPEPLPEPAARPERDDLARRLERASRYLATMPPSIAGSGGHLALWRAALALVLGFNLSADDALRLLVEEFSPRCSPIWSVRELCHKVRSAVQRGRLEPGWLADRPLSRGA